MVPTGIIGPLAKAALSELAGVDVGDVEFDDDLSKTIKPSYTQTPLPPSTSYGKPLKISTPLKITQHLPGRSKITPRTGDDDF